MKLTSGCSTAEEIRKRPLPDPISRTTGLSLPNTFARSSRMNPVSRGLITMSAMKDHAAAGDAALRLRQLVHRNGVDVEARNLPWVDHGVADPERVRLLRFDQLEPGEVRRVDPLLVDQQRPIGELGHGALQVEALRDRNRDDAREAAELPDALLVRAGREPDIERVAET